MSIPSKPSYSSLPLSITGSNHHSNSSPNSQNALVLFISCRSPSWVFMSLAVFALIALISVHNSPMGSIDKHQGTLAGQFLSDEQQLSSSSTYLPEDDDEEDVQSFLDDDDDDDDDDVDVEDIMVEDIDVDEVVVDDVGKDDDGAKVEIREVIDDSTSERRYYTTDGATVHEVETMFFPNGENVTFVKGLRLEERLEFYNHDDIENVTWNEHNTMLIGGLLPPERVRKHNEFMKEKEALREDIYSKLTFVNATIESDLDKFINRLDVPMWFLPKVPLQCPHMFIPEVGRENIVIYSATYGDRSGAVIEHMISAYAYAFQHGLRYGGGIPRYYDEIFLTKRERHEELIMSTGLDDILKFALPAKDDPTAYFVRVETCLDTFKNGLTSLPADFIAHLQVEQKLPQIPANTLGDERKMQVAVHIRRGDAQPCTESKFLKRYHPNAYYLKILDKYVSADANVTIFSEADSFESFDEFSDRGYNLRLDGPITEAWTAMRTADVFIMSPGSAFSFVPALLNPNQVYFHFKINHWIVVPKTMRLEADAILDELIDTRCESWLEEHPHHKNNKTGWD